ncbi:MAG TPA: hypothetical protein VLT45_21475 [Kofleriaceae bacterium]|nr:hypothetical protein [Kofleriaceae bacterium]
MLLDVEQRRAHLARRVEAIVGVARECLERDRVELGRAALVEGRGRHDLALLHLEQRLVLVLAREQRPRRQQLVQDHAARPEVAAAVEILATGDRLRRHVRELALHASGLRAQL